MHPLQLKAIVERLPAAQRLTDAYEAEARRGRSSRPVWYKDQRQHLVGWLSEYSGPGAYGRANHTMDAAAMYNHLQCAPALLWLAEALGERPETVREAIAAVRAAPPREASQCAAVRRVIPWSRIEALIAVLPASLRDAAESASPVLRASVRRRGLTTVLRQRAGTRR